MLMIVSFFSGRNNDCAPARQTIVSFFSGRNENFPPQQKNCQFPARTKNSHNTTAQPVRQTTVSFFSGRKCKNCAPNRQTVDQKPCSRKNQTLTQHNKTTGKKVPPAHAKRVYLFLRPSVCESVSLCVRAKRV